MTTLIKRLLSSGNRLGQCFVLVLCGFSMPGLASLEYSQERQWFREAEKALADNNQRAFKTLTGKLADYPLLAYLEYDAFKKNLDSATPRQVRNFLEENKDYPFHYHLLSAWLEKLAKRGDWKEFLVFYDDRQETRFKCLYLKARLKSGKKSQINEDIRAIWMSGYSQPKACDEPFEHFLKTDSKATEAIWQRIEKAFNARRPSLARYLGRKLNKNDQALVELWYQAHQNPGDSISKLVKRRDNLINRKILIHAFDRLARFDSLKALKLWEKQKSRFSFSDVQVNRINKRIALSAAYQHQPESKDLLQKLPESLKNDNAHLWLARIHLRDEDWIGLIKVIRSMPSHLSQEAEWVYWLARAYDEAGHSEKADDIYAKLASRSTYYGFLAADKANKPYRIEQMSVVGSDAIEEASLLNNYPHLLRARELFYLDRRLQARREWFQAIRKMKSDEIKQAASLASNWKWHDNAIKTVAKTSHRNDYDLRFPMPYQSLAMPEIKLKGLDPAVIYGIMRRESLFDPLAKSRVGALGLMQLMPYTARSVAKSLGLKRPKQADILQVNNNIKLGTTYFRKVLDRFDDNVSLAAAAYNAGPKNVTKWLPEDQAMPADLWVETVPFKETRNYIQAVLAYATIFDKHLGQDVQISSRMHKVRSTY